MQKCFVCYVFHPNYRTDFDELGNSIRGYRTGKSSNFIFTCTGGGDGRGASMACHKSPQMMARLARSTDASSPD